MAHLHDELIASSARLTVDTRYGKVIGGRASNGAAVFLGRSYVIILKSLDFLLFPYLCRKW